MSKRVGSVLILVESRDGVNQLNEIISNHAEIIIGRQGIRLPEKKRSIISLVLEGSTDEIGSLTGQLGRISGVQIKSLVLKADV
jgi:putative iron-only hydrogenase system regulator